MASLPDLTNRITQITGSGRVCWIVGENGAGKSMLLRSLAQDGSAGYIAPPMLFPPNVTVSAWRRFNCGTTEDEEWDATLDALCPDVPKNHRMDRLSTGEAKRFMLWSLLRTPHPMFVLDEPFEHLSPGAKTRLWSIIEQLAQRTHVVVATNQDIPETDAAIIELV